MNEPNLFLLWLTVAEPDYCQAGMRRGGVKGDMGKDRTTLIKGRSNAVYFMLAVV